MVPKVTSLRVDNATTACRTDDMIPEMLLLRFRGRNCIEARAGSLWRALLDIDPTDSPKLDRLFPADLMDSLLTVSPASGETKLRFWRLHLDVGCSRRLVEAQVLSNPAGEHVILLRDITLATRAQANLDQGAALVATLSPRELQVLRLVVCGEPNKSVAANLAISEKTVEKHRARIMQKTGARHAADLIRMTYPVVDDLMSLRKLDAAG